MSAIGKAALIAAPPAPRSPRTMNRIAAIRRLITENGTPWVICSTSPTELRTANRAAIIRMPTALPPASQATRKPMKPYPGDNCATSRPWIAEASAMPARPATPPATAIEPMI